MSGYVLAIDQGTTSSRAIVFDADQQIVGMGKMEFTQHFPASGWVEHVPDEIWATCLWAMKTALKKAEIQASDIAAIGITNQRETTIVWDRATGKPIHNAIVWQDRRTAKMCERMKKAGVEKLVSKKTGLLLDPYFSATKIAWILDNVPGARKRAERGELAFGTVDSFLICRLTNGAVHATDASNACRTLLYNIETGDWDDELLALFRVPRAMLPVVKDNADDFGVTERSILGAAIAIRGSAGDQQAATVGQACFEPGMMKSTYGTGCFALLNTGSDMVRSKNRLLTTVAYRIDGKTTYALEGAIFVAGASVQWLRDKLRLFKDSADTSALAKASDPMSEVYLVPAFVGLGAPWWDAEARGAYYGLTRNTSPADLTKAALEVSGLPDAGPPGGDAQGLEGRARHGAARRWRHGGVGLDHAVFERHSGRAGRPPGDPRDHGAGRGVAGRMEGGRVAGHARVFEALVAGPAVQPVDGSGGAQEETRRLDQGRAADAELTLSD